MTDEQWKDEGKCSICRRQKYCKKDCKARKERTEYELKCLVSRKFFQKILEVDE